MCAARVLGRARSAVELRPSNNHQVLRAYQRTGKVRFVVHISAKVDHGVRTLLEIAAADQAVAVKAEAIAAAQQIPPKVLESVLADLRRADLVTSRRGPDGGYRLARPATAISIADIIRAIEGPLASVRGMRPEDMRYRGAAEPLQQVWIAVRVNIRTVLENVTLFEVAAGRLPEFVETLTADPGAWARRESGAAALPDPPKKITGRSAGPGGSVGSSC